MTVKPETLDKLREVSVATLATALFKRGLRHQVIQDVRPVAPKGKNMVGPAFTLRYMPAREDRNQLVEFRNPKHPQRHAIETCPPGHVLVMDSRKSATAASAGDILITRLMVRGGAGVVTDGKAKLAIPVIVLALAKLDTGRQSARQVDQAVAVSDSVVLAVVLNANIHSFTAQSQPLESIADDPVGGQVIQRGHPQPQAAAAGQDQAGQRRAGLVEFRVVQGVVVTDDKRHQTRGLNIWRWGILASMKMPPDTAKPAAS